MSEANMLLKAWERKKTQANAKHLLERLWVKRDSRGGRHCEAMAIQTWLWVVAIHPKIEYFYAKKESDEKVVWTSLKSQL